MEQVAGRPEQILQVGLEAGVVQGRHEGVEDVGDGTGNDVALRERPDVWLVLKRAPAVELQFCEDVLGRRGGGGFDIEIVAIVGHGAVLRRIGRAHRGLRERRRKIAARRRCRAGLPAVRSPL